MLIELKDIEKKFRLPSGQGEVTVLRGLSLQVEAGEAIAVIGPSGSGKSTLLNIIGALDRPTSGTARLGGQDLSALSDTDLSRIRNQKIGFVFQMHYLLPQCTVLENVLMPTIPFSGKKRGEETDRAKRLLDRVGLGGHLHHFPAQLSGGEMQRVAVIRSLINQPQLILADEPTGSLDRDSSTELGRLLIELNAEERTTLVVVTHSQELARLMERVYRLQNGRLEPTETL